MATSGWGRLDLSAASLAYRLADDVSGLERLALEVDAMKVIAGPRQASLQLGRRSLDLMERLYPGTCPGVWPPHHCVVVGASGAALDTPLRELLTAFAQSSAAACLAAAVRFMPLGSAQAQEMLTRLDPALIKRVDKALDDPEAGMFTSTPALDIRCHQQAGLFPECFRVDSSLSGGFYDCA